MAEISHHLQHLHERLLYGAVEKSISEKLGILFRNMREVIQDSDMDETDAREAKLILLEMIRTASGEFYLKMKSRIESKGTDRGNADPA